MMTASDIIFTNQSSPLLLVQTSEIRLPSGAEPCMPMPEAGDERLGVLVVFAPHSALGAWIFLALHYCGFGDDKKMTWYDFLSAVCRQQVRHHFDAAGAKIKILSEDNV